MHFKVKNFHPHYLLLLLLTVFSVNVFADQKSDTEYNKATQLNDSIQFYFEKNQDKYDLFAAKFSGLDFHILVDSNFRKVIIDRSDFLRRNYKYSEAIPILNRSISVAKDKKDTFSVAFFHKMLSSLYYYLGDYDSTKYQLDAAYKLFDYLNENAELGIINIRKAGIEYDLGHYEEALKFSFKALELNKQADDKRSMAISYLQLGNTFYYLTNYRDSKKYFELSSVLFKSVGYDYGYYEALSNVGLVEIRQEEYRSGISKQFTALKFLKEGKYAIDIGKTYNFLEDAYFGMQKYDSSLYYNDLAIKEFEKSNFQQGLCESYLNSAKVYLLRNQLDEALRSAQESYEIASENSYNELLEECNFELYKIYKKLDIQSESYFHLEEYVRIKDSLNYNPNALQGDATKYQLEAEEAQLKQQLAEDKARIQLVEGEKTQTQLYITIFIAIKTLILLIFSIYYLTKNRKLNKSLVVKKEQLAKELREKEALLNEIHHRVKNNLQVINSMLSLQTQYITDVSLKKLIDDSRGRITSMSLIHESLYKKKDFKDALFSSYIEELIPRLIETYCIDENQVQLVMNLEPIKLSLDDSIPCGLIINEIISNSLKHAFPVGKKGIIKIELVQRDGFVYLTISDDGVGFVDDNEYDVEDSFGFLLIETLASQLEAEMTITTLNGFAYHLKWEHKE